MRHAWCTSNLAIKYFFTMPNMDELYEESSKDTIGGNFANNFYIVVHGFVYHGLRMKN